MMNITIETSVEQSMIQVMEGFDESLFKKLSPPFPPVKLLRFDGSKEGDLVSLELNFLAFRQKWTSKITEDGLSEDEFYFIDEGVELPFFLKYWRHKHRVIQKEGKSIIRDEITFNGPNPILTALLYPALYGQFLYRKPIYKKIFKQA